jgi:hypothetical protein
MPNTKFMFYVVAATLVAITAFATPANAQLPQEGEADLTNPLQPLRSGVTENHIFSELLAHNQLRTTTLLGYTVLRTYQVVDLTGKVHAEEIGRMEYHAPDKKTFVVQSEAGSGLVRRLALSPLIASEIETAAGKEHHDSAIVPANYTLQPLGEQQVGPYHCFVVRAIPKRRDKYLFEGKVWIDDHDYAVVRIDGHPAKKLSFWIERADFVRRYQKIGNFWLPQRDETFVQVRLYGKKALTIAHQNYVVTPLLNKQESAENAPAF